MTYGRVCVEQGYHAAFIDIKKSIRATKYRQKIFDLIVKEMSKENYI